MEVRPRARQTGTCWREEEEESLPMKALRCHLRKDARTPPKRAVSA